MSGNAQEMTGMSTGMHWNGQKCTGMKLSLSYQMVMMLTQLERQIQVLVVLSMLTMLYFHYEVKY